MQVESKILWYTLGEKNKDSTGGIQWEFEEEFGSALFYCSSVYSEC